MNPGILATQKAKASAAMELALQNHNQKISRLIHLGLNKTESG